MLPRYHIKKQGLKLRLEMIQIAVAGNIGSGKTTLTKMLSKSLGWDAMYEDLEQNPYINDFYGDMPRWSFNLQIYFLHSRLKQIVDVRRKERNVIQDRTVYEDAYIFAPNLHQMGLMTERDFNTYTKLFNLTTSLVHPPELLIYIKSSSKTLVRQIASRGRDYEKNISPEYLDNLNELYNKWIQSYNQGKLLIIDIDEHNFLDHKEEYVKVLEMVREKITSES